MKKSEITCAECEYFEQIRNDYATCNAPFPAWVLDTDSTVSAECDAKVCDLFTSKSKEALADLLRLTEYNQRTACGNAAIETAAKLGYKLHTEIVDAIYNAKVSADDIDLPHPDSVDY